MDSANGARSYALTGALTADVDLLLEGLGPCTAIRVGAAGDLSVVGADGIAVPLPALIAGEVVDIQATKILAAGTTATKITVFW